MWAIDTLWFEVAIVSGIFAIGNIVFGHFEEQTSKARRIAKYLFIVLLITSISHYFGRTPAMILLGVLFIPVVYIHAIVLPSKGINGWTGEPKDKYYELRGWSSSNKTNH